MPSPLRPLMRGVERWLDKLSIRPIAVLVFGASLIALVSIEHGPWGRLRVPAVAQARPIEHAAPFDGKISKVHVTAGDLVNPGMLLVTLDTASLSRQLAEVESQRDVLAAEWKVSREERALNQWRWTVEHASRYFEQSREARLAEVSAEEENAALSLAQRQRESVDEAVEARRLPKDALREAEEREAAAKVRRNAARKRAHREQDLSHRLEEATPSPPATDASAELYSARLKALEVQAQGLRTLLSQAEVRAKSHGRVAQIAPLGAATLNLPSLATLIPIQAEEIVAYIPAKLSPNDIEIGGEAWIVEPAGCAEPATIQRIGAQVALAPGQISGLFNAPVHGLPVHLSIPSACSFGVGQLLNVELKRLK